MEGLIKGPVEVADIAYEPPPPPEPPPEPEKKGWLDIVQTGLDIVGMIPGVGVAAGLINAGISAARGDYAGAALNLVGCIPFAGAAAKGAKLAKNAKNAIQATKAGQAASKAASAVGNAASSAMNAASSAVSAVGGAAGKVLTKAKELPSNLSPLEAIDKMKSGMKGIVLSSKNVLGNQGGFVNPPSFKPKGKDITKITVDDIPTEKSGKFNKFFNSLTSSELDELWKDKKIRKKIERQLRAPGGLHEWHLVSRAPQFKYWNIGAEKIKELRTTISDVKFVNPNGVHGGLGSTKAHNELLAIIDTSSDYNTFVRRLNNWANYRLEGGVSSLPKGLKLK